MPKACCVHNGSDLEDGTTINEGFNDAVQPRGKALECHLHAFCFTSVGIPSFGEHPKSPTVRELLSETKGAVQC